MSDNRLEDHHIDDRLADFTDQVLDQEAGEPLAQFNPEGELGRLQKVVWLLKQVGQAASPAADFSARLRAVLQKEWPQNGPKARSTERSRRPESSKTWGRIKNRFARQAWGFAAIALAILLLVVVALPENGQLAGAAGTSSAWHLLEFGIGALVLGLLVWLLRKKD